MNDTKQTEAQRLAELLEAGGILEAADELRRLDAIEREITGAV